ncbi:MAG: GNAT family N-acetyltransferase [Verrucomicrobiia bacterium]|jgi:RimJ/RimL family protein N-acetyltransferase
MSNSNCIEVRPAVPTDAEALQRFVAAFMEEDCPFVYGFETVPSVVEEEKFIRLHTETSNSVLLLAEQDGRIVGMLTFRVETRRRAAHCGKFGMTVLREYRRRGIGRALLNWLFEWVKDRPTLRRVELGVFATNVAAIKLYKQFGFVLEGCRRGAVRIGDTSVDDLCMARLFDERY